MLSFRFLRGFDNILHGFIYIYNAEKQKYDFLCFQPACACYSRWFLYISRYFSMLFGEGYVVICGRMVGKRISPFKITLWCWSEWCRSCSSLLGNTCKHAWKKTHGLQFTVPCTFTNSFTSACYFNILIFLDYAICIICSIAVSRISSSYSSGSITNKSKYYRERSFCIFFPGFLPFRYPINCDTLIYGGMLTHRCTWSGHTAPSTISTSLHLHNVVMTSLTSSFNRKRQTIRHRIKQRRFSAAWFSAYIG